MSLYRVFALSLKCSNFLPQEIHPDLIYFLHIVVSFCFLVDKAKSSFESHSQSAYILKIILLYFSSC